MHRRAERKPIIFAHTKTVKQMDKTEAATNRYAETYNKMLGAALQETEFKAPIPISPEWYHYARIALCNASPIGMHLKPHVMRQLWDVAAGLDMNLELFAMLNNTLQKSSMVDLALKPDAYFELMEHCEDLAEAWQETVAAIDKELQKTITEIAHQQQRQQLTGKPGMNVVKGEA